MKAKFPAIYAGLHPVACAGFVLSVARTMFSLDLDDSNASV